MPGPAEQWHCDELLAAETLQPWVIVGQIVIYLVGLSGGLSDFLATIGAGKVVIRFLSMGSGRAINQKCIETDF